MEQSYILASAPHKTKSGNYTVCNKTNY